jgi:hypothetical protein
MMKNIVFSFCSLFILVCHAQKYQPVDSTTIWNTGNSIRINSNYCCYGWVNSSFQIKGFELNNGNVWLKLYESALYSNACPNFCPNLTLPSNFTNAFIGFICNDTINKKVFFTSTLTANYTPSISNIVYDFLNKNVGDSIYWRSINSSTSLWSNGNSKFKINSIDSFLFAGKYHKRYLVTNNTLFNYPISLIEGVGSTKGAWNSIFTDFEAKSQLTCFSKPQQGVSVSNYTTFAYSLASGCGTLNATQEIETPIFSVYPNPATNKIEIKGIEINELLIFDVFGKLVLQNNSAEQIIDVNSLEKGIYFLKLRSGKTTYTSKFLKE